jgi:peroxiredoxin
MAPSTTRLRVTIAGIAIVLALLWRAPRPTLQTPAMPDVQTLGPQVGARVPEFALLDQHGQSRSLASLMGKHGLMLVFFRSADWCPYCKTQLAELQTQSAALAQRGLALAAVSYDPVAVLADFSTRRGITFPLLSDPGSATIKRYGILNTTIAESDTRSYGIPFPGTFMLNAGGVVTSRYFEPAYQERATVRSILARLGDTLDVPATRVSSPQIDITTFTSDTVVAPGTHFSIVLDIRPTRGVHVYAPSAREYRPITLSIHPRQALVVRAALYPAAEDYYFKPLNEHVLVYQHPFRIVQDVTIDASAAAQTALAGARSVTIDGVLEYQACTDKICFAPKSQPLSWTVSLRELDRERAHVAVP